MKYFKCYHLKFTVNGRKQASIHTHFRNAVMLVWGSLRLTPKMYLYSYQCFLFQYSYSFFTDVPGSCSLLIVVVSIYNLVAVCKKPMLKDI